MKKIGLIAAGVLAALIFTYGSLASLVNQGMSLPAAVAVFIAIIAGGIAVVKLLGNDSDAPRDREP
jgi:predicted tellurium resistance membrane protein TerC